MRYRKLKIGGRTVSAHRAIVEAHLGRPLTPSEVVHHRNGDRLDNRIENLQVLSHAQHSSHHNQKHPIVKKCEVCQALYEPHPTKRRRQRTCSWACRNRLLALIKLNQAPALAEAVARANTPVAVAS